MAFLSFRFRFTFSVFLSAHKPLSVCVCVSPSYIHTYKNADQQQRAESVSPTEKNKIKAHTSRHGQAKQNVKDLFVLCEGLSASKGIHEFCSPLSVSLFNLRKAGEGTNKGRGSDLKGRAGGVGR